MTTNSGSGVSLNSEARGRVKGRILLIEDHPDIAQLLVILLESKGYQVWVETCCSEVLPSCAEHRPQVILLDLGLSEADHLYATLRTDPQTKLLPLVLLTQAYEEPQRLSALELRPTDSIARLPHIQELLDGVKAALNPPRSPRKLRLTIDLSGLSLEALC
jgi:two-component system KDP operon response regulator KdpE